MRVSKEKPKTAQLLIKKRRKDPHVMASNVNIYLQHYNIYKLDIKVNRRGLHFISPWSHAATSKAILAPSVSLIDTLTGWTMVSTKTAISEELAESKTSTEYRPTVCHKWLYCSRKITNLGQSMPILSRQTGPPGSKIQHFFTQPLLWFLTIKA